MKIFYAESLVLMRHKAAGHLFSILQLKPLEVLKNI